MQMSCKEEPQEKVAGNTGATGSFNDNRTKVSNVPFQNAHKHTHIYTYTYIPNTYIRIIDVCTVVFVAVAMLTYFQRTMQTFYRVKGWRVLNYSLEERILLSCYWFGIACDLIAAGYLSAVVSKRVNYV